MRFTCAFMNCQNLFSPGAHPRRFSGNSAAFNSKINSLAQTIRATVDSCPDLIGLCEVGEESLGFQLGDALAPGVYQQIWSGPPPRNDTGLVILYRTDLFRLGREWTYPSKESSQARVKYMAALLQFTVGERAHLWFVVNHWQSDMASSGRKGREDSWRNFSTFFQSAEIDAGSMIVTGDFNCEPGDEPLVKQEGYCLEATRERELVLGKRRGGSYLYNPMWRHLGEVDFCEDTLPEGHKPARPVGTYCPNGNGGVGWKLVDQLLVTKSLLLGTHFQFEERTLKISRPLNGCSDHCAVGASFRVI